MAVVSYLIKNFPDLVGLRLDKALSYFDEIKTRSRAETLLEKSLVLVNGKTEKNSYKINGSEEITVNFPEEVTDELTPYNLKLEILFEDADLLIVNKPSGLVVHPGAGHHNETLVNALIAHTNTLSMKFNENRPGIVHRIDKETSGLLVVAKNDWSHEALTQQFKNKTVHRIYQAVCWGPFAKNKGTISSTLARHPTDRKRFASVKDPESSSVGKHAITHYEVLKFSAPFSFLKFKLETGRTHQIRVHISELGHPIVGDIVYGSNKKLASLKDAALKTEITNLNRFLLHAGELGLQHPRTGENLFFKIDWPIADLEKLKKWNLLS